MINKDKYNNNTSKQNEISQSINPENIKNNKNNSQKQNEISRLINKEKCKEHTLKQNELSELKAINGYQLTQ